jgi:hypothetical protein
MPYGTIKIDTITFTDGGVDKSVPVSGLILNPTFTGNVTVTGTISGNIIQGGTTVSGLTVTGTTANFASGVFTTQISGVTITGTTVSTTTGNFTSLTGTTATITSGIIASGTAALPSLAILSDPNTGIYSPGADQLAVATNGTGRLFVSSAGLVGVGINPPSYALDVKEIGTENLILNLRGRPSDNQAYIRFASNDNATANALIGIPEANTLNIFTNNNERLRITSTGTLNFKGAGTAGSTQAVSFDGSAPINSMVLDSSGRLGIGTSSPIAQLNNTGTTALGTVNWPTTDVGVAAGRVLIGNEGILVLRRETVGADSGAELYLGATSGAGSTTIGNVSLKGGTENASNRASFFSISTQNTVGTGAEAMRITSGGLVGIGTTGPGQLLQVGSSSGAIRVGTSTGLDITHDNSGFTVAEIKQLYAATSASAQLKIISGFTSFHTGTSGTEGARIRSDGMFEVKGAGVSGSSPAFSVNGSAPANSAIIDTSGRLLVGTTSALVDGFNNAFTSSQLSKGSADDFRCISDTRSVAAVNNSTVDVWVVRTAAGNPFNNGLVGHFYVQVGGANAFSGVYSIVTTGNGTSSATLTAVSTVTRGTSPVSSVQIANDGANGAIKLTITYINNAGVVDGLTSYVSFIGLAAP